VRHAATAAVLTVGLVSVVLADGSFFVSLSGRAGGQGLASSAAQKAVIIRDGAHEILLLQTTYSGPAAAFAWVVPVPSRPAPDDIFIASSDFIKGALLTTQPTVSTGLRDPWAFSLGMAGGFRGIEKRQVTVWQELLVGDYQVAVLSATGGTSLVGWLRANGYSVPASLGPVAAEYARKRWCFVALKMNPRRVGGQALLKDVQPLGLRFEAERLVYPLRISAVSAPERTTLVLVVYAPGVVQPRELPTVGLPSDTKLARGEAYQALVRRTLAEHQGRALLVEDRRPPRRDSRRDDRILSGAGLSQDFTRGTYREGSGWVAPHGWALLSVSRFYGLLPREALADLTLERGPAPESSVRIRRGGTMRYPAWAEALWRGWPQFLVVVVLAALAYRRQPPLAAAEARAKRRRPMGTPRVPLLVVALLGLTAVALWAPLVLVLVALLAVPVLLLLAMWVLAVRSTERNTRGGFWTFWVTVAVVVSLFVPPVAVRIARASFQPDHPQRHLTAALAELDGALKIFADTHHCYPARLSDLTDPQPAEGLDVSGNPVAIASPGQGRVVLGRLPVDPLTHRRDSWVYDVLSPGMVDSGGYEVFVRYTELKPE
jgi:hypothetical protein